MTEVFILLALIFVNALFVMSEIALVSARKGRLESMANKGDDKAKAALDLTTNPEKLIPTILSRVTRLNLKSHSITDIVTNLENIAKAENVNINSESLNLIATRSDGGQRDAINLLEIRF